MADYINNTFRRMDLQQICSFLLYGVENNDSDDQPYNDKLKNASDPIYKRLADLFPDKNELDEATADLTYALITRETVYMELGMKAGARLICQLLLSKDYELTERN